MLQKKITDINIEDIQILVDNEVGESKILEYKKELHIDTGDQRKEFLADISAFANADGGTIIYGIEESNETNLPSKVCGITIVNEDELLRKVNSLLRDSIAPRIPDIDYRIIQISDENQYIFIMQVKPSYMMPHRVIYKNHDKFYVRNPKGKHPMDIGELRQAFNMSDNLYRQIEEYKLERISVIDANRYRQLDSTYPAFIIQAIPLQAFRSKELLTVIDVKEALIKSKDSAFDVACIQQVLIDGIALRTYRADNKGADCALGRFYINGIIEKATNNCFEPGWTSTNRSPQVKLDLIFRETLAINVIDSVKGAISFYLEAGISPPVIISCAIINGEGFTIPRNRGQNTLGKIDRNLLLVPDVVVDDLDKNVFEIVKPILDSLWNSCGYMKCEYYDDEGNLKMER